MILNRKHIITAVQFLIWWIANSLYAVDAQTLLRKFDSASMLIIDLAFFQIVVGMAMILFLKVWRRKADETLNNDLMPSNTYSFSMTALMAGVLHVSGAILTNFSYRAIGSTTTLVWKLTEPCAAVVLKQLILKESTNILSLIGVLVIVAGVLTYSVNSTTVFTLSPIILANILFPTRNVVMKLQQKKQSQCISTEQRYFVLLYSSLPFCLGILAVKILFEPPVLSAFPFLLRNAILFNAYQFASISLLEKLDALTHSLANTMKRFMGILLSAFLLRERFSERHIIGLVLTAIGFPLYVQGRKIRSVQPLGTLILTIILFASLMIFAISPMSILKSLHEFSSVIRYPEAPMNIPNNASEAEKQRAYIDSLKERRSDMFIMAHKYISQRQDGRYEVDETDVFSYRGGNLGNLLWEHAAIDVLPDFSGLTVCNDTRVKCYEKLSTEDNPKSGLLYHPTANIFHEVGTENRSFDYFVNSAVTGHTLLVGAGIQADFGEADKDIKNPKEQRRIAVANFEYTPGAKELLATLENYSHPMLMRGDMTLQTAQRAGYHHGISAGCPTLFLNKDIYLGKSMESNYEKLKDRIGDKSLKVGVNLHPTRALHSFFLRVYEEYPNSVIFAQGAHDGVFLQRANIEKSRVRIYTDIKKWQDGLREMDVVLGARIHGSMAGVSISKPVFVIAPDYRVLELVQRMKIPHMTVHDERLNSDFDVAELMYNERFNGSEFDHNRCGIAKLYRSEFEKYGFGVSSHVRQISEIC